MPEENTVVARFRSKLNEDREAALRQLFDMWVEEMLDDDGPEEVARVLTYWAMSDGGGAPQLTLGDDETIVAMFATRMEAW